MKKKNLLCVFLGSLCLCLFFGPFAFSEEAVHLERRAEQQAIRAYEIGKYQEASAAYQRAYQASLDPTYLFNAALSEWQAARYKEAQVLLNSYFLKASLEDPLRKNADALFKKIENSLVRKSLPTKKGAKDTQAITPIKVYVAPASLPSEMLISSSKKERSLKTRLLSFGLLGGALIAGSVTAALLLSQSVDGIPNVGSVDVRGQE